MFDIKFSSSDFHLFQELIFQKIGITLNDNKKDLLISRLSKRIRTLKLSSFRDYYNYIKDNNFPEEEMTIFIDRITTRKTDFFRENHHFNFLKNKIFPELLSMGKRRIRIWSAGCSSGEEPYSIAITVKEFFKNIKGGGYDVRILATDISNEALTKASNGVYKKESFFSVSPNIISEYFDTNGDNDNLYQAKEVLKDLITFGQLNLIYDEFKFKSRFDVIFCRNVIIYFDKTTVSLLMKKYYNFLDDKAYIFLGHAESLLFLKEQFNYVENTIYQKR
ncbi:MAG: CheR family methyltransferase [bacterium]